MKPPRPVADPAPGTAVNVATVGRWWVQQDGTGIDLAVSHPGYGWVGLYLDQTAIEQLKSATVSLHHPSEAGTSEARVRAEMRDFDVEVLCTVLR